MNILYIEPDFSLQNSYGYYFNMLNAIAKKTKSRILPGKGYKISVDEIKKEFPEIDLICFGFGWMNVWKNGVHYVETLIEGIEDCDIPKAVFLNKEYGGGLGSKLGWIKEINADFAFTYHHDYKKFEKLTGVPFHFLPFAADPEVFKDHNITAEYDIGFTGGLGHTETNGWENQCKFGEFAPFAAEGQGWSHELRRQVIETAEAGWDDINFNFSNHKHDDTMSYAKRLNTAKMWLSTTGPVDIVGTRYYELMLTNTTLLMCNRSKKMWSFDDDCNRKDRDVNVYEGLFEEDVHYVAFDSPEELRQKVLFYKNNEAARLKIVQAAYENAIKNHTWDNRAEKFINVIKGNI